MFISKKKANLLAGKFNLYGVFDKVSKHYIHTYFNSSDEDFIRLYLPEVILKVALRDLEVHQIGTINDVTGIIEPCPIRKVTLNCYKFPKSRLSPKGEDISHEEIQDAILSVKNQLQAENSTVVEDEINEKETEEK